MDRRRRMLEIVQRAHAKQSRNNGRIPYWTHLLSVAQIVEWAVDRAGEVTDEALRDDLFLTGLGHDLYEDTAVQRRDVELQFGERVDAWIHALTNDGDRDRTAYLERMAAAPEAVKLVKLGDLVENTASCSYAIVDMGVEWTEKTFLPIVTEMREVLSRADFVEYARTAALLRELLDYNYERLCRNIEMFRLADELSRAKSGRQPNSGAAAPLVISEEAWQRALARTRERERKEGERFKGPIFFVPSKDD
jgi:hypothetical protein